MSSILAKYEGHGIAIAWAGCRWDMCRCWHNISTERDKGRARREGHASGY